MAYADVDQRVEWTTPSADEVIVFETHDFPVGGIDQFIWGTSNAPEFAGTTRYEDIVKENESFSPNASYTATVSWPFRSSVGP